MPRGPESTVMPPTRIWLQVTPMSGLLPGQFPPVVLAALVPPVDPAPPPPPLLSLEPEPEDPLADRLLWWARLLASIVETNASPTMSASASPAATILGPPPRMMSRSPSLRSLVPLPFVG